MSVLSGNNSVKERWSILRIDDHDEVASDSDHWNFNTHYYPIIEHSLRGQVRSVLDVGSGEGMLTRRLRRSIPSVVGIDSDEASVDMATAKSDDIEYICGDVLSHPFERESFDAVVSVATLHHMDPHRGLLRMAELLRPGGTLVVVGCAGSRGLRDRAFDYVSMVAAGAAIARRNVWKQPSPIVWPPPVSYRDMRTYATDLLPGSRFRRELLFRYSIRWTKPHGKVIH
jgi:SAM-dependent methyltransferase